jgi:lipoprotein-anchoring transpeptidase ErfK/SrfK
MCIAVRFRSVGFVVTTVGAVFSAAAALAQPLALSDPSSRYPGSIFQEVMPQMESIVAEPDQSGATVPAHLRRQIVSYPTREGPGTVVIDTPNTYLYYVLGGGKAIRYGIGVGREGFTWSGVQNVSRKSEWPDWIPPAEMLQRQPYLPRFMAGGPGNPLGARAMYLGNSIYRIHGTNQPSSIGGRVSSGCIRLLNQDVIDLYNRVNIGTKVVVLPMGERRAPIAETIGRGTSDAVGSVNARAVPASGSIFGPLRGIY